MESQHCPRYCVFHAFFFPLCCWTHIKTSMWHKNVLVNYFYILKFTGLFRINRIINIDCCCLVDFILNIWSFGATCRECCCDSCFDCIVWHFAGSNWEKGTKSKTLSFSSWSESRPKECGAGSGHDEERYEFIQQTRRKDPFVYFLIVPIYPIMFPASPEVFPVHCQKKSLWVMFFHIFVLMSLNYLTVISFLVLPTPERRKHFLFTLFIVWQWHLVLHVQDSSSGSVLV